MIEAPNLPNLNGLVELANRDGVDIRPTLLRVMTDLYVQKPQHTEQEEQHFTELALRLIDLVDAKTRAIVADKIAGYPTAPAAVRHRLLKELISLRLPNRPRRDRRRRQRNGAGRRAERAVLCLQRRRAAADPAQSALCAAARRPSRLRRPSRASRPIAWRPRRWGTTASCSPASSSASSPSRASTARRLYEDQSGEPIVVAAVALGMPATVLQRILLCLNPAISQSVQRVYELALLHEEIEPDAALRLVAIWQASHPAEKIAGARAAHQPQYWQDEKRERSAPPLPVERGPRLPGTNSCKSARPKAPSAPSTPPPYRENCARRGPRPRRSRCRDRT